jgi:hypothetical protein
MAVAFEADQTLGTSLIAGSILVALGIAALVTAVVCVFRTEQQLLEAISIALFGGWFLLLFFFVAAMSISGDWL